MPDKSGGGPAVVGEKGIAHFVANFKCCRADGRPKPGQQTFGWRLHGGYRGFENAIRQTTPAGMRRSDRRTIFGTQQQWQAVGGQHGANPSGAMRNTGIGLNTGNRLFRCNNPCAMHLR